MSSNDVVTDRLIGTGTQAFTSATGAAGRIRFLDSPDEVLDFIDGPDVESTVVISRGGTTTFMSPALMAGVVWIDQTCGAQSRHLRDPLARVRHPLRDVHAVHRGRADRSRDETIPAGRDPGCASTSPATTVRSSWCTSDTFCVAVTATRGNQIYACHHSCHAHAGAYQVRAEEERCR